MTNIRDVIPSQEHQWMQNLFQSLKFQVQQPETLNLKQKTKYKMLKQF
jgi:hypothetical protein